MFKRVGIGTLAVTLCLLSNPIKAQDYQSALELVEGDEYASYFIAPAFKDKIKQALQISDQNISPEALNVLQSLDVRGLKLMATYEEALSFAKSQNSICQSILSNFHSLWHVMNMDRNVTGKTTQADSKTKVSQSAMYCNGKVTYFSFTPLGRLNDVTMTLISEENNDEILKTFEEKLPSKKIETKCTRQNLGKCEAGIYFYKDQYSKLNLEFEDKATFKDGKYFYVYEMELSSDYLKKTDNDALKRILESNNSKQKTKL